MPLAVVKRMAQEYRTQDGREPFKEWIMGLTDHRAQAKITKAVTKMEGGNFGDHTSIAEGNGLYEHRIHYGPGYRIYYITEGDELIILFAGSVKSDQQQMINLSKDYLSDYKARKPKIVPEKKMGKPIGKKIKRKQMR